MCETIMAVSEPTFYSQGLGLANGMPSGVLQALLEQVHLTFDMPWYLTIMSTTVIMRICVLPLVIEARKASVRQANCTPQINEFMRTIQDPSVPLEKSEFIQICENYENFILNTFLYFQRRRSMPNIGDS